MTFLLVLAVLTALALLAPRYGVDSRGPEGGTVLPPADDKLWSRR